ncbi:MAG: hypothetical protein FD174_3670 [Geobacteraceae bacterium]|nr:MAG: hypothetical protein FD174_3670 [Geobacteraceae bacterium]
MRNYLIATLVLLSITSGEALAESQPPSKKTISSERSAYQVQRGTEESPLVVKTLQPPKSNEESNKDADEKGDRKILNILTGCLAAIGFFQLLVFSWQGWHLKRSVDTVIAAERPYLLVETKWKREYRQSDEPPHDIRCVIKNFGKTPGIITYFDCKLLWDDGSVVDYGLRQPGKLQANGPLKSGEDITLWPTGNPPEKELWDGKLICYGRIHYNSIFKQTFITEFHHVYESALIGFRESKNRKRNRYT